MLNIGEFSKLCLVTRKTLRHYDEIGLLKPEQKQPNGYRLYGYGQLRTMRLIQRLKGYGCSLPEIAMALARPEPDFLAQLLEEKQQTLQNDLQRQRSMLQKLEADLTNAKKGLDIMKSEQKIETKEFSPLQIYSVRRKIGLKDFNEVFEEVIQGAQRNGLTIAGPFVTLYHDEDFNPERSELELGVVVRGDGEGVRTLTPGLCCYATYHGPYDSNFSEVYTMLAEWATRQGYAVNGAPFDVYLKGCGDEGLDPKDYVTEVYFPIRKG